MKTKLFSNILRWAYALTLSATMAITPRMVQASAPVSGPTFGFGSGSNIGTTHTSGQTLLDIALGDLDNDGDLDVVGISSRAVGWANVFAWRNDGSAWDGVWDSVDILETAYEANSVALGDLDRDGFLDLIVGFANGDICAYRNDGSPWNGWGTSIKIGSSGQTMDLALGDLDRDGNLDIVSAAGTNDTVVAWQNNSTPFSGSWISNTVGMGTDTANTVVVGDLDRDGWLDIASGHATSGDLEIISWENNHTPFSGLWTSHNVGATQAAVEQLDIGDLDGDGDLDLVSVSLHNVDDEVVAWRNNGDWTWLKHNVGAIVANSETIVLGDLDLDGDLDIVVATYNQEDFELTSWQNDGTPWDDYWVQRDLGSTAASFRCVALGDLDRDGDLDIVTGSGTAVTYEAMAWQNVLPHRNMPYSGKMNIGTASGAAVDIAAGDIDNDGDLDLVTTHYLSNGPEIVVWENDSTPWNNTWVAHPVGNTTSTADAVALGDLDGDGDLDIVVGTYSAEDKELIAWRNDGGWAWTQMDIGSVDANVFSIALGDLNRDGNLDLVAGSDNTTSEITAWTSDGAFNWVKTTGLDTTDKVVAVALGDIDRDGILDIVSGTSQNENYEVIAWEGDGAMAFTQHDIGATTTNVMSVALGDLDGDGKLDIVTGSSSSAEYEVIAWQNNSNPWSGLWTSNNIGAPNDSVSDLKLDDLDLDGDLDIVTISSSGSYQLTTWQNDGTPFSGLMTGTKIANLPTNGFGVTTGDLDRDGDPDIAAALWVSAEDVVQAWQNQGGIAGLATQASASSMFPPTNEEDLLKVAFTHNGISTDPALELNQFNIHLLAGDCSTPLSSGQAQALLSSLRVRLDDGDGVFETSDTSVVNITTFNLTSGVQSIPFSNNDANVYLANGSSKLFWISVTPITSGSLCVTFDPEADALVEAKHGIPNPPATDFSVSIQDTQPLSSGKLSIGYFQILPLLRK